MKILKTILVLILLFGLHFQALAANTNSADFEESSSQYLSISHASQTGLGVTTDFTLEFWMKLEQLPSDAGSTFSPISKQNSSGKGCYRIWMLTNDTLYAQFLNQTGFSTYGHIDTAFDSDDVGTWIHIAVVADISAQTFTFYKNGSSEAGTMDVQNISTVGGGTDPFHIGAGYTGSSPEHYFDGRLDDVRVWSDIRTAQEISDNYDSELVGNEANLEGYWKVNNSTDDETSNSNDLTNNNSVTFPEDPAFEEAAASAVLPKQEVIGSQFQ